MSIHPDISYARKVISTLQNALERLRQEAINLPFSDFRQQLLSYAEVSAQWESISDLQIMRETIIMIFNVVDRETEKHVSAEIKKRLEDVRTAIDQIMVT